jgi:hypothetical protein
LSEFFDFDWVNDPDARPEILFLRRENPSQDDSSLIDNKLRNTKEAHVAFPGGRMEEGDEGGLYTGSSTICSVEFLSNYASHSHASNMGGNRP